ncbi:MAG TPA: SDR family NAD(P)-dependent oxidoreductase [Acidimicrobiia bacterium]|nr:SDR family NAD(P)-dependent oxidoreductase [Acidimicrobiia bacterium]
MTDRIALVTGGGQGIGAAICRRLADSGYRVVVNDLDGSRAQEVATEIGSAGGSATSAVADVADSGAIDAMFDRIEHELGTVTLLVNNAGIGGNAAIRNVTDEYWRKVAAVDLDSVLYCARRALGPMREERRGSIVNIASRAWLGWWGQSTYAAAKAGVVGMTRALAVEMASRGVRVNAIAPGLIDTPMLRNRSEEALARLLKSVPMGRPGTPADIANAVEFLASDRARTITGQVLYVCGGKSVYAYPDWSD